MEFEEAELFAAPVQLGIPRFNIILLGPSGAGKSSLINSVASAYMGDRVHEFATPSSHYSVPMTTRLMPYDLDILTEGRRPVTLWDTWGLIATKSPSPPSYCGGELESMILGTASVGTDGSTHPCQLNTTFEMTARRAHCIIFVVAVHDLTNSEMLDAFTRLYEKTMGTPSLVLLSHVDEIISNFPLLPTTEQCETLLTDPAVKSKLSEFCTLWKLPPKDVYPLINNFRYDANQVVNKQARTILLAAMQRAVDHLLVIKEHNERPAEEKQPAQQPDPTPLRTIKVSLIGGRTGC
ncbi:hypothetical protein Pelo_8093 [Pelomyxa schiedti]|nr:hypothetical protein Pelo_8093 [Pelomyxa schiedti]